MTKPTPNELQIMLNDMKDRSEERHTEYRKRDDEIVEILKEIKGQLSQISERLFITENASKSLSETISRHDKILNDDKEGLLSWRNKITGSLTTIKIIYPIFAVLLSTLLGLYIKDLKTQIKAEVNPEKIAENVVVTLEEKFNLKVNE